MTRRRFPYVPGAWLALCDRCGFKFYNTELRPDGEKPGLMVCSRCWDARSPLRNTHVTPTTQSIPWARPDKTDVFHFEDSDDYANRVTRTTYTKSH